jgi:hypothetical protein
MIPPELPMSKLVISLACGLLAIGPALAATPDEILSANKAAMGGGAWDNRVTLKVDYAYSGQGLIGTTSSLEDLKRGAFVDSYNIPPTAGASGWDGEKAWEKEPSGTVTDQSGGDVIPLAITEAYQDQNLWWQPDRGGAQIVSAGQKTDGGATYDALTVTPKNGKPFEAWFDPHSRLLYRTIEENGTQTITTTYSDYAPVDGVAMAKKLVVDDGSHNLQTFTFNSAKFSEALPAGDYRRPAENLHDFSIAGGAHETTVPFHLWNNHIYADVSVNGSKPMTFIFDTGGHSILAPATAKALGVEAKGNLSSTGGGDNIATSGEAMVKSLTVGGATITDQPVTTVDTAPAGTEGANEKGMIGYEFFARFITRFDYGKHTITFLDKKYFDPKTAGIPVPMRLYHQFPEILGSYDGVPGRFGIDTGSRMPLLLNKVWAAKNGLPKPGTKTIEAQTGWGVGGPTHSVVFRGGTLKLGNVTIEHPLTMVSTDKGGAGAVESFPSNVGGGVLKRFAVTFDYDNSTMYLKPIKGHIEDVDTFDKSGMWINAVPEGFKVIEITKGGPAQAAGLQKDDIITAVDAKPAADMSLPAMRERLRNDRSGKVVKFTVKRSSETKQISVTLTDMI